MWWDEWSGRQLCQLWAWMSWRGQDRCSSVKDKKPDARLLFTQRMICSKLPQLMESSLESFSLTPPTPSTISTAKPHFSTSSALRRSAHLSWSCWLTAIAVTPCILLEAKRCCHRKDTPKVCDPLPIVMFALASNPLIKKVATPGATQPLFADDASSGGRLRVCVLGGTNLLFKCLCLAITRMQIKHHCLSSLTSWQILNTYSERLALKSISTPWCWPWYRQPSEGF